MSAARRQILGYTDFTYILKLGYTIAKPKPVETFLKPFEPLKPMAWVGFLASSILVGLVGTLVKKVHPHFKYKPGRTSYRVIAN